MKYNKERRLFTAFTITIAIVFVTACASMTTATTISKNDLLDNERQALGEWYMNSPKFKDNPKREEIKRVNEERKRKYLKSVNALLNAKTVTIYALEPKTSSWQSPLIKEIEENKFGNLPYAPPPQYHAGILSLGQAQLEGNDIKLAATAYREAVGGAITMCGDCSEPRHAIRAEYQGHVYDYIICYECLFTDVHKDGEFFLHFGGRMNAERTVSLTDLLKKYDVPLPYIFTDQYKKNYEESFP